MATSKFDIDLNVKGDGTVTAKLNGIMEQFRSLDSVIKKVINAQRENEKTLKGTVKYYDQQIAKTEALRDRTAKTTAAYKYQTEQIEKLRLAKAKLTDSIKQVQLPMEGTLAAYRREIKILRDQQQTVAKSNQSWQEYEDKITRVKTKINDLTGATRMSVKPNQDLISNAGLAGATLTEFSRTISDLPYGIQGVANNLGQLSTLFITFVSKSGGFKNAIAGLVTQLTGPLGWILALQGAITALEFFSREQDKAKRASKELEIQIVDTNSVIRDQTKALDERANKDKFNQQSAQLALVAARQFLQAAEDGMAKFNEIGDEAAEAAFRSTSGLFRSLGIENAKLLADESIGMQQRLDIGNKIIDQLNKRRRIAEEEAKAFKASAELTVINNNLKKAQGEFDKKLLQVRQKEQQGILTSAEYRLGILNTQYKELEDSISILSNSVILNPEQESESANEISSILRDLEDELAVIRAGRFEAEKIQAQQEYTDTLERIEKENLSVKEAEEARALAADLRKAKIDKINEEQTQYELDLTEKNDKEMASLKDKTSKEAVSLIEKETTKRINAEKKAALENIKDKKLLQAEFNKIDQDNIRKQIEVVQAVVAAGVIGAEVGAQVIDSLNSKLMSLGLSAADSADKPEEFDPKKALSAAREVFNAGIEAAQAALDAELSIEEAKTAKVNNELRKRLDNENLSAEERQKINDQMVKNEEELQKKRDKIAEKQFKIQKALSIANTLINTGEAAMKAYKAFAEIPPLAIAAAAAATAFGLAQVNAISRQQFVPSAIGGRSSSGSISTPAIQAPDFNVVGQSQTSQLAALVQAQLERPVKTYVVASEVSTAQELERKRISAATI
jgi:hypothetical protein